MRCQYCSRPDTRPFEALNDFTVHMCDECALKSGYCLDCMQQMFSDERSNKRGLCISCEARRDSALHRLFLDAANDMGDMLPHE